MLALKSPIVSNFIRKWALSRFKKNLKCSELESTNLINLLLCFSEINFKVKIMEVISKPIRQAAVDFTFSIQSSAFVKRLANHVSK